MKKLAAFLLSVSIAVGSAVSAFSLTDTKIYTDPVRNIFLGKDNARSFINNLKFRDIDSGYWANEAIVRAGALDMVKGYNNYYQPSAVVTNQEALAFILRVMGLEQVAQARGVELQGRLGDNTVVPVWALGYLATAQENNLITEAQYNSAMAENRENIDPRDRFFGDEPATREQVATWLVQAVNFVSADTLVQGEQQKIYSFSDWKSITAAHAPGVEICTQNNIMKGLEDGRFNPQGGLTRAEMAQILSNLDSKYYSAARIERRYGTIGGIRDVESKQTGTNNRYRNIYVRANDGKIDVLQYRIETSNSPQAENRDCVVYKNGAVLGLPSLKEGDEIEYLIKYTESPDLAEDADKEAMNEYTGEIKLGEAVYIKYNGGLDITTVNGTLEAMDYENGQIHIMSTKNDREIYYLAEGLYGDENAAGGKKSTDNSGKYLIFSENKLYDDKRYDKDLPYGSSVKLTLNNNIVSEVTYVGDPVIINELRGIVTENNSSLGYLTVIDNKGNEVTKNYYENDIKVEKQQYYDSDDEIGYIDQVFPNFKYDPRDTSITEVEPGDIVFIRCYKDDPDAIESISASTNYVMKYGKLQRFAPNGKTSEMTVRYENGAVGYFDVPDSIFISKAGKPADPADVQSGDWVRILVNQAIIQPGYMIESVKEISVENSGHDISSIIKGTLGAINLLQKEISVQNAYKLTNIGWSDYSEIKNLSVDNNDIEYYYNGNRVSLDYISRYLKHSDNEVYVAMENNFAGERVSRITFAGGRDELLSPDTVTNADGLGNFSIINNDNIATDLGTIVRRHGRLVSGYDIMTSDFARVSLNGGNYAAVVDIYDEPSVSQLMVSRGRILSVDEGNSFTVKSMSILNNMKWVYSPIEREYTIDNSTVFMDESGVVSIDKFIDYTSDSVVNKVYTIISDGSKALYVLQVPYTKYGVRGTVYSIAENTVNLKDGTYYDNDTGMWGTVSAEDNGISITTTPAYVVIKNNKVGSLEVLEEGDVVKVMVNELPEKINGSMSLTGYVLFVESQK